MTPIKFTPAQSLEEANERLRAAEQTLADQRVGMLRYLATAMPDEVEPGDDSDDDADCVDADEFLARLKASVEGLDGQH